MAKVPAILRDEHRSIAGILQGMSECNADPLVAERESRDFRRLFARVVPMTSPPVGVGPAAGRRAAGSSRSKA